VGAQGKRGGGVIQTTLEEMGPWGSS